VSGMDWSVRRELAIGVAASAHKAECAMLVADQNFGKVAPPALCCVDLITLALASGCEHQHLDLGGGADEAGCGHCSQSAARDLGGGPAKA